MRRALVAVGIVVALVLVVLALRTALTAAPGPAATTTSAKRATAVPATASPRGGGTVLETVRGQVRAYGGVPLRGVRVWVDDVETVTDEEGRFEVPDRPRGRHRIVASAPGRMAEQLDVGPGAAPVQLLLYEGITREGTLELPPGVPREGIEITFRRRHGGREVTVTTDADGHFECDRLQPYGHHVRFRSQRIGDRAFVGTSVLAFRFHREPVRLEPSPGDFVGGVVLAPDGTPLEGARVEARAKWPGAAEKHLAVATSDAAGRFELIVPQGVTSTLIVSVPGDGAHGDRFAASRTGGIAPGRSDVEVRPGEGATIRGEVRDDDDAPVAGASIEVRCIVPGFSWVPTVLARTDRAGRFVVDGLCAGRVRVSLAEDERTSRRILLRQEVDAPSEGLALRAVAYFEVRGRIVRTGDLVDRRLQYGIGKPGESVDAWRPLSTSGDFAVDLKPRGTYEVRVRVAGDDVRTCGTVEAGAEPVELRIPHRP